MSLQPQNNFVHKYTKVVLIPVYKLGQEFFKTSVIVNSHKLKKIIELKKKTNPIVKKLISILQFITRKKSSKN